MYRYGSKYMVVATGISSPFPRPGGLLTPYTVHRIPYSTKYIYSIDPQVQSTPLVMTTSSTTFHKNIYLHCVAFGDLSNRKKRTQNAGPPPPPQTTTPFIILHHRHRKKKKKRRKKRVFEPPPSLLMYLQDLKKKKKRGPSCSQDGWNPFFLPASPPLASEMYICKVQTHPAPPKCSSVLMSERKRKFPAIRCFPLQVAALASSNIGLVSSKCPAVEAFLSGAIRPSPLATRSLANVWANLDRSRMAGPFQ